MKKTIFLLSLLLLLKVGYTQNKVSLKGTWISTKFYFCGRVQEGADLAKQWLQKVATFDKYLTFEFSKIPYWNHQLYPDKVCEIEDPFIVETINTSTYFVSTMTYCEEYSKMGLTSKDVKIIKPKVEGGPFMEIILKSPTSFIINADGFWVEFLKKTSDINNTNQIVNAKANFSDFWKVFKDAVSTNNQNKITELTTFPFWDFYSPTGNKWIQENEFAKFFQNNINKREIKLAIKAVSLDGKETKTSLSGCTANMKEEKDKKSLTQLRSGFKLDNNARVFTLSISWEIDPDRAIEGFSKFYFAEVEKTFRFIGSGMSPD
ncbi:MAG: hypothetical protein IPP81_20000 [Chitinophagaceae bacterium]|nr:hypothetical protein [Chitinophagaceae bacterium]